jgi:hypothetical protein
MDRDISLNKLDDEVDGLTESQWIRFQILTWRRPEDRTKSLEYLMDLQTFQKYSLQSVRFVHRSAADFLLGTKEGRGILTYSQTTASERTVKGCESEIFARLVGLGFFQSFPDMLEEVADITNIDDKQFDHLLHFVEKGFYRLLEELEMIRGHKVIYGTKSIYDVAKKTVDDFIQGVAKLGYIPAIRNYVDYVQAKGLELTDEFKNFILFNFMDPKKMERYPMGPRPRIWRTHDHDMLIWLLKAGADPLDSKHAWNWRVAHNYPFHQNVSAFESFAFDVPNYTLHAKEFPDGLSLANTLKKFLEHRPRLGKRMLYSQMVLSDSSCSSADSSDSESEASSIRIRVRGIICQPSYYHRAG